MKDAVSRPSIYKKLTEIAHPQIHNRNLVELGMIPQVQVAGHRVGITLAFPHLNVPFKEKLTTLVSHAVQSMAENLEVKVDVKEMSTDQRSYFLALAKADLESRAAAADIDKIVAVMSGKGGVGKSSLSALLACSLRRRGYRVGILDADITGPSIPKLLGVTKRPTANEGGATVVQSRTGIKLISINLLLENEDQPVIWRGPMISKVIEQFWRDFVWGRLDYLIVDLPPGTSDAAITVTQSLPLNGVVLVTSPQDLAGMVVRKAANLVKQIGVPLIGIIENMTHIVCPECDTRINLFGEDRAQDTARKIGSQILGQMPMDPRVAVLCDRGEIEEYQSVELEALVDRILPLVTEKTRKIMRAVSTN